MENISLDNFQQSRSLNVAQLQLNGFISKHGVANFLNIPFAQFPGRFRTAKRLDLNTLTDPLDASRYGPRCPQKIDNIHPLMHNMFEKLSTTQRCDETTCLHLNVYAPPTNPGSARPSTLPVFVWIHGGGFNNGDNTTEFGKTGTPDENAFAHRMQMATTSSEDQWISGNPSSLSL